MVGKSTGQLGEDIACCYLERKGYKILERNYVLKLGQGPRLGEIDIVARKDGIISFIEVKSLRNSSNSYLPEDKVNFSKRRKIIAAAQVWLGKNKKPLDSKWQIDVITVRLFANPTIAKVRHIENI